MFVVVERHGYSESQSLSDSTAVLSVEEGEGGSGGSNSCIRYLSFIQGLTSSWRERERERMLIPLGIHIINFHQFTLSRSDSRNGINCKSSESDSSMNQLAMGIPLSS